MLSVIVSVYNEEKYLPKCLESIMNQKYQHLEILLIDDGSTDRSGQICDRYSEKDSRIKVLHKENEGLVRSRKTGLSVAKGDYIAFVDGDDWIDTDMYSEMMEIITESKADFVSSGFIHEYKGRAVVQDVEEKEYYLDECVRHRIYMSIIGRDDFIKIYPSIWSKIFKADVIRNAYHKVPDELQQGEDVINLIQCILLSSKIIQTKREFYHYNYRDGSISNERKISYIRKASELWNYCGNIILKNDRLMKQEDVDFFLSQKLYQTFTDLRNHECDLIQYYTFPCIEKIFNKKTVLYGAGMVGKDYLTQISKYEKCEIVSWIDKEYKTIHCVYRQVMGIEALSNIKYDVVLIAVLNEKTAEEIKKLLTENGIPGNKIMWYKPLNFQEFICGE